MFRNFFLNASRYKYWNYIINLVKTLIIFVRTLGWVNTKCHFLK